MEKERKVGYQTGIASEYLVLAMLYRLGAEAYMSVGNKKSVDIRVIWKDGKTVSIDVKSVLKKGAIPVDNVEIKENHFVVFVTYNNEFGNVSKLPDFYIVPSKEVAKKRKHYGDNDETQYRIHPKSKDEKYSLEKYQNKWELIVPKTDKSEETND